nr:MAG TPA: hypothetical protein [Caudoviricetes sp.]
MQTSFYHSLLIVSLCRYYFILSNRQRIHDRRSKMTDTVDHLTNKKAEADFGQPCKRSSKVYLGLPRIRAAPTGSIEKVMLAHTSCGESSGYGHHILYCSFLSSKVMHGPE